MQKGKAAIVGLTAVLLGFGSLVRHKVKLQHLNGSLIGPREIGPMDTDLAHYQSGWPFKTTRFQDALPGRRNRFPCTSPGRSAAGAELAPVSFAVKKRVFREWNVRYIAGGPLQRHILEQQRGNRR